MPWAVLGLYIHVGGYGRGTTPHQVFHGGQLIKSLDRCSLGNANAIGFLCHDKIRLSKIFESLLQRKSLTVIQEVHEN
jgi:hypothetical protein